MKKTGRWFGIPFDWRPPTMKRFKERMWNPNDRRIVMPKVLGWGFTINLYEVARRLRLVK